MIKKIIGQLFLGLLFSPTIFGKIITDDVYQVSRKEYLFSEVCSFMLKKEYPLIEMASATQLECMSEKIDVGVFCDKKQAEDAFLARGFIDKKSKTVICQSARRVILKYACEGKSDEYCQDVGTGCYQMQEKLARRLKVAHQSLTADGPDKKVLNCYFSINDINDLETDKTE